MAILYILPLGERPTPEIIQLPVNADLSFNTVLSFVAEISHSVHSPNDIRVVCNDPTSTSVTTRSSPLEISEAVFAARFNSNWLNFIEEVGNSRHNPLCAQRYPVNEPLRAFRGPKSNYLRVLLATIHRQQYDRLNFNDKALVRRALYMTQFGIIAFEFCDRFRVDGQLPVAVQEKINTFYAENLCRRYRSLRIMMPEAERSRTKATRNEVLREIGSLLSPPIIQTLQPNLLAATLESGDYDFYLYDSRLPFNTIFWKMLSSILCFRHTHKSAPESQVIHLFWAPLFELSYISLNRDLVAGTTEFYLDYNSQSSSRLRVDYAGINVWNDELMPLFYCEAAANRMEVEGEVNGFYHKDYSKMAWIMGKAYLHYAGKFRAYPEILNVLRIYGAFVSGTQIQFVVMYATDAESIMTSESGQSTNISSLVFQTDSGHWLFDFGNGQMDHLPLYANRWPCETLCEHDPPICVNENGQFLAIPTQEPVNAFDDAEADEDPYISHQRFEERSGEREVEFGQDWTITHDVSAVRNGIISIIEFFREVTEFSKFIKEQSETLTLGESLSYPSELARFKPESASKHSDKSPQKPTDQTPGRFTKGQHQGFANRKHKSTYVQNELEMLEYLSTYGCPHIVKLFSYQVFPDQYVMDVEKLVDRPEDMTAHTYKFFLFGLGMLLDILDALLLLESLGVVHRDVAPQNIMFSDKENCWKLIDFETAVKVNPSTGVFEDLDNDRWVGTEDYVAPESRNSHVYSSRSDLYSLCMCYIDEFSADILGRCEQEDERFLFKLAMKTEDIVRISTRNDPDTRMSIGESRENLCRILEIFNEDNYGCEFDYVPKIETFKTF